MLPVFKLFPQVANTVIVFKFPVGFNIGDAIPDEGISDIIKDDGSDSFIPVLFVYGYQQGVYSVVIPEGVINSEQTKREKFTM